MNKIEASTLEVLGFPNHDYIGSCSGVLHIQYHRDSITVPDILAVTLSKPRLDYIWRLIHDSMHFQAASMEGVRRCSLESIEEYPSPGSPREPMEFLARSWTIPALEVSTPFHKLTSSLSSTGVTNPLTSQLVMERILSQSVGFNKPILPSIIFHLFWFDLRLINYFH